MVVLRGNHSGKTRGTAAFTLVDVVISFAIFGIGFLSLYAGISSGVQVIHMARENLRATQIMVEKMETARLYSWDQVVTGTNVPSSFVDYYYPSALAENRGASYHGVVSLSSTNLGTSYDSEIRVINVTLHWTNFNVPHRKTMTTFVTRDGLQNYIF